MSNPNESPPIYLNNSNFKIAIRLEVETDEPWFNPDEIDRYLQITYKQVKTTVVNKLDWEKSVKNTTDQTVGTT